MNQPTHLNIDNCMWFTVTYQTKGNGRYNDPKTVDILTYTEDMVRTWMKQNRSSAVIRSIKSRPYIK